MQNGNQDNMESVVQRTGRLIDENGFSVILVGEDPPYGYTVGLSRQGHPELVIAGFPIDLTQQLLSDASRIVLSGDGFSDGSRRADLIKNFEVGVRMVEEDQFNPPGSPPDTSKWIFPFVFRLADPECGFLQIELPDPSGKLPSDSDCDPQYRDMQAPGGIAK